MMINEEEMNLIKLIRYKYRFGEIVISTRDGSPHKIKKVDYFDTLKGSLKKTNPQIDWEFIKHHDGTEN